MNLFEFNRFKITQRMTQLSNRNYDGFVLITVLVLMMIFMIYGLNVMRDARLSYQVAVNDQLYSEAQYLSDSLISKFITSYNQEVLDLNNKTDSNIGSDNKPFQLVEYLKANQLLCYQNGQFTTQSLSPRDLTKIQNNQTLSLDEIECDDKQSVDQFKKSAKALVTDKGCYSNCDGYSLDVKSTITSCRILEIRSTATVSKITSITEQWVSVLDNC